MFDVAYRLVAVAGAEDELFEALCASAAASRDEAAVSWFEVYRSDADPRSLLVVERYDDEAGYQAHRGMAHYAAWKAASAGRIESSERFTGQRSS